MRLGKNTSGGEAHGGSAWVILAALSGLVAACGGGGSPAAPQPSPTPTPSPPNIVLIMADDLDGGGISNMPRLKALLTDQGVTFANAFATTPLCAPSRASFLTGQYAHNHGVLSNGAPRGGFERFQELKRDASTVATWLKAASYRTALLGKYLNNYPAGVSETYIPPGWDEWYGVLSDRRAELALYSLNENGRIVDYRGRDPQNYQTDVLAAKAVDFILRAEANDSQPFFLFVAVSAPHRPAIAAERHEDALGGIRLPRTESFNEEDVSDKPQWVRNTKLLTEAQIDAIDAEYGDRQRSMLAVDELVQRVVQTLDGAGELANTYVVFTSDNGIFQGEHRQTGKAAAYEEAITVPLIVRGPGVPAGRTLDHLVAVMDLAPTFAALGRATAPDFVDGRSLEGLLGLNPLPTSSWRKDLLIEHLAADGGDAAAQEAGTLSLFVRGMPDYYGLRTESETYVEYTTGEKELYELRTDRNQLQNLTQGGVDPTLVARLSERVAALRPCRGAACRN